MKKTRILITGASGFIGKFLIDKLLQNKNNIIVALFNKTDVSGFYKESEKRIKWVQIDLINDNISNIALNIDVVYHLAGYFSISQSSKELTLLNKINVFATEKLAHECKRSAVKHFIFISSVAACESSNEATITENSGLPSTVYGESKKKAEDLLMDIAETGLNVTILRPTAIFGEGHKGSVFELVKKIKEKRFVIFGSGESLTNFYYIRDFIDLLSDVPLNENTYNKVFIASDESYELNTIVNSILEGLTYHNKVIKLPIWLGYIIAFFFEIISFLIKKNLLFSYRRLNTMTSKISFSNNKIFKIMNTHTKYGVLEGLNRTIKWYKSNNML